MLSVRVQEVGTAEVRARFLAVDGSMRSALRREMLAIGQDVQARARGLAPSLRKPQKGRVAGALRSSIKVKLSETDTALKVAVRPGKFYARFVESGVANYGTKGNLRPKGVRHRLRSAATRVGSWRVPPRPFMGPAARAVEPTVRQRLEAATAAVVAGG